MQEFICFFAPNVASDKNFCFKPLNLLIKPLKEKYKLKTNL